MRTSIFRQRLLAPFVAAAGVVLIATSCGGGGGSSPSAARTTATEPAISSANFLAIFSRRTHARVKVTYTADADSSHYILTLARDDTRWMHSEIPSAEGGDLSVGSTDPVPGAFATEVRVTQCTHLQTTPVCHDGVMGSSVLEDYASLTAEDDIGHAAGVGLLGVVSQRGIAGRQAACVTINGTAVTQRLTDGSKASDGTVCIDMETGVVLSWQSPPTGGFAGESLSATKVEVPTPADFRTPVPST